MKINKRKFVKKQKTGVSKIPKQRKIQTKGLRLLVWGGVVVLSFSGVFAYWQIGTLAIRVHSFDKEVTEIEKRLEKEDRIIRLTPEIESFMNRFVALFMNVTSDRKVQDERDKMLVEDYFGEGMNLLSENRSIDRELTSASFVSLKEVDGLKTAVYKVSYTIKEKKEEKNVESKVTQLLNIPFVTDGIDCRVISSPYFLAVQNSSYNSEFLGNDSSELRSVDSPEKEKIQSYIEEFLTKYAESSASDMRYMMEEPEGLLGVTAFSRLESCRIFYDEKGYLAKISVVFTDKETHFEWIEQMTLNLIKKDKNYYVEKLTHSWND